MTSELPDIAPVRPVPDTPPTADEQAEQQRLFAEAVVSDLKATRFAMLAAASQSAREAYALVSRESPNLDRIGRLVEITSKALAAAETAGRLAEGK